MNTRRTSGIVVIALGALLFSASADAALSIDYEVTGTSVGVGGDTVALGPFSSKISLNPGESVDAELNTVSWTVTSLGSEEATTSAERALTIVLAASSQKLQQTVYITIAKKGESDHQTLQINPSTPLTFNWAEGKENYALTVAALEYTSKFNGSQNQLSKTEPGTLKGRFSLSSYSVVPEPSTLCAGLFLLVLLGFGALRSVRR